VHCTFAFVNLAVSPSAVAKSIVTPVPHCPVMVALAGSCENVHTGPVCVSSVPLMVNEFPVICTLSKVPDLTSPVETVISKFPCTADPGC
jgi:hypothetical protein